MNQLTNRVVRAIRLDPVLYEEVEHDKGALGQATLIVILSSLAAGIGALVPIGSLASFFWITVASLISWFLWAGIVLVVGTKILPQVTTSSDFGELLRVFGFSVAPGFFRILGAFGYWPQLIFVVISIWMLAAMVIAVRQALDYSSTGRAILVCLIGWFIQWAIFMLIVWLGVYMPGTTI